VRSVTNGDLLGLVLSYGYAGGVLVGTELLGRRLQWAQSSSRKLIHIAAGMWVWGLLLCFDHWYLGVVPLATFIGLNYLFYRRRTFAAMDAEQSTPGTVYFAFSITVLLVLLWRTGGAPDRVPIAVAATMAMTWGDAMASLVGERRGRHRYTVLGHTRSLEGSVAMAVFSFAAMLPALVWLPGSPLSPGSSPVPVATALLLALAGTVVATLAEAVSPAGTDNLSVPLFTGLTLLLLHPTP